jgi:RNA polymerase sigma-70 factor (ECF subfamily)
LNRRSPAQDVTLPGLLQGTAAGDSAAFRALYEKTAPKLFGVVLRILRDRATAEEVLQETYVKIWRRAGDFSPREGQPIAWLAAIARNQAIDRLRSEKVMRASVPESEDVLARLAAPADGDPTAREA